MANANNITSKQLIPYQLEDDFRKVHEAFWLVNSQCRALAKLFGAECGQIMEGLWSTDIENILTNLSHAVDEANENFEGAYRRFKFEEAPQDEEAEGGGDNE